MNVPFQNKTCRCCCSSWCSSPVSLQTWKTLKSSTHCCENMTGEQRQLQIQVFGYFNNCENSFAIINKTLWSVSSKKLIKLVHSISIEDMHQGKSNKGTNMTFDVLEYLHYFSSRRCEYLNICFLLFTIFTITIFVPLENICFLL